MKFAGVAQCHAWWKDWLGVTLLDWRYCLTAGGFTQAHKRCFDVIADEYRTRKLAGAQVVLPECLKHLDRTLRPDRDRELCSNWRKMA